MNSAGSNSILVWMAKATPLALAAAVILTACGGSPSSSSASVAPGSAPGTLPKPEVSQVNVGDLQATTAHDAEVALADGLFTKNGLTVNFQTFTSQGSEVTALLAGQIDIALGIGVAEDIASQNTNSQLEVVMTEKDNLSDNLYTSKNVKTAADLKGKSIAISSFGSVTYGEALIAVKQLGLGPSDVTITQVGNDAARRAALFAGSVAGSLNDESELSQMTAGGANVLLRLSQLNYGLPVSDVVVTKAYAQKNPNVVLAIMASLIDGLHTFLNNPADAEAAAVSFEHVDMATATTNVEADIKGWRPVDGRPILADMQAAQALYVKTETSLANVDIKTTYTTKFVDQLKSLGWYSAKGITTS
jgi:NitT/TauT family transport system substrate-binding protein